MQHPTDPGLTKLVIQEARRVYRLLPPGHVELEDLIQNGWVAVYKAQQRFDRARHVNFELYARKSVRGYIIDHLGETLPLRRAQYRALRDAQIAEMVLDRPSNDRLPDAEVVTRSIVALTNALMIDQLADEDPETQLCDRVDIERLKAALSRLKPDQLELITACLDLNNQGDNAAAYAKRMGIHRSTIGRRFSSIINELRKNLENSS